MDKVLNSSDYEYYTPSSERFKSCVCIYMSLPKTGRSQGYVFEKNSV
jgi:hypothetical protein